MWVEISDREGWVKRQALDRLLIHIGSDPRNDIVLHPSRGGGVVARHAQIIAPIGQHTLRVVNLSPADLKLEGATSVVIPPRGAQAVRVGDCLCIGDFRLRFIPAPATLNGELAPLGSSGTVEVTAPLATVVEAQPALQVTSQVEQTAPPRPSPPPPSAIEAELHFNSDNLQVHAPLDGRLTVRNRGDKAGVQFHIEVSGVPEEVYQIGAAPVLFPNAEKTILIRLTHPRSSALLYGAHTLTVRVSAPEAYPDQEVLLKHTLYVQPYLSCALRILTNPEEDAA